MKNDNSETDKRGHLPGRNEFWTNDRLSIIRHCEGVFTLECHDVQVMPPAPFETITRYLWQEFFF